MLGGPGHDRPSAAGKAHGAAAREYANQQAGAAKLLFKLIAFPFRLPFHLANGLKERREIRAFIHERAQGQPIDDALINDLTAQWVAANPKRYPHGRYDRKFDKIKARFEREAQTLQQRRGY